MEKEIQEYCDTQGDNYQVAIKHGEDCIEIDGGDMSGPEWEDVAEGLIEILENSFKKTYELTYVSRRGITLWLKDWNKKG